MTHGVLAVGALGRMGERVRAAVAEEPSMRLQAAIEAPGHPDIGRAIDAGVTLADDPEAALVDCAVAIDFSTPAATLAAMRAAADAGVAYVCGTTGCSDAERSEIAELATRIPVVHAPNFSLAVNLLAWLSREAARRLGTDYDAELVDFHPAAKRDAPRGTALQLAKAVASGRDQQLSDHLLLERAGEIGARPEGAIAIQTLRGGDNPGEHTVMFAGHGERLELTPRARHRAHPPRGAVRTALWLIGRPPALYPIDQVFDPA